MSLGLTVFAFLLVLGPLVFIHELGHFIAAKRSGIRVMEFGMGYPPRAVRLWRGRGSLRIGSRRVIIPRNFKQLPKTLADGQLVRATASKVNDDLVLKDLTVQEQDPIDAPVPEDFTLDEARLYGEVSELDPGTEYTLNWLPLGGFVRMYGEEGATGAGSFVDAPKRWRAVTLLAGPGANIIAAILVFAVMYMTGYPEIPVNVEAVAAGGPAEQAGLKAGDVIVAVDGRPIRQPDQVRLYINQSLGHTVMLTVQRGDQRLDVGVYARLPSERPADQGATGIQLGTGANVVTRQYPPGQALVNALGDVGDTVQQIVTLPTRLLNGLIAPGEARVMGPVAIGQVAGVVVQETIQTGQAYLLLNLIAQISLALAITNLLPLPALDGGRLLFVVIEALRRKRITPEREALVHLVGFALLLGLMVLITIQDFTNPIIPN